MQINWRVFRARTLGLALSALVALPVPAPAAPPASIARPAQVGVLFEVNTTGDGDRVGSGLSCDADASTPGDQCTLRAAIQATNAHAGDDGIEFAIPATEPGCVAANRCTINVANALPTLNDSVSIVGPGQGRLTVRSHGGSLFRVTTSGAVVLSGMTITGSTDVNGVVTNTGGGTLSVTDCAITGNSTLFGGGGIYNDGGTLNVTDSTISNNSSENGGGIYNNNGGTVTVNRSTISGNLATGRETGGGSSAGAGGGIFNLSGGVVNVINSTISGNIAQNGGGIATVSGGVVNLTNSTVSSNVALGFGFTGNGGGFYNSEPSPSTVNVKSSIIALNRPSEVEGVFASHGFNLVGQAADANGFTQPTDQTGTPAAPLDPKLDPDGLQAHGGPVKTIALLIGSPAIDKGSAAGILGALSTDQRGAGFPRVVDEPAVPNAADGADAGAFESRPTSTLQFSVSSYAVNEGAGTITITVKRAGSLSASVAVNYIASDGTARAGEDYVAACGSLTFAAGQTSRTFTVQITNDTLDETNETLNLSLAGPTKGAALGATDTAVLTITDNDLPPRLAIGNTTITEGNSGTLSATFTVTLTAASGRIVTVKYATANGTAKAPGDYTAKSGTLSFAAGQTSKTLTVAVRGDLLDEANETFFVNLSSPTGATISDAQGLCTITDNDN
ncbi:MAG TPA: Calx-beta domain-containing protein [Pyrinomonadaceae bacterium]|nr:Calx-beta domain-containing protein [Pyrinomonadaceae bacterium]